MEKSIISSVIEPALVVAYRMNFDLEIDAY